MAVPGPTREAYDKMQRMNLVGKSRIEQLETELVAARALVDKQAEMTQILREEHTTLAAQLRDIQSHEDQLEDQFIADQMELGETATTVVESQNQLMAQNQTIERLTHQIVDRTNEVIDLRARLRAPSGPSPRGVRKGRAAKFPVLHNISPTVEIPLDPAPLPDPPASSTESSDDTTPLKRTNKKTAPIVPATKQLVKFWNDEMHLAAYPKFGEMEASPIPEENDWRLDFSTGYLHSKWNSTIIRRLVALTLAAHDSKISASVDPKWLEQQLTKQLERWRGEWARLQPRAIPGIGMETAQQAAARTVAYLEAQSTRKKSNSSKFRKYATRMSTISITIEQKIHKGERDVGTWQRLMDVMGELDTGGMSSEEEDEAEYDGLPTKIYKVKVCEWRAPVIADYVRQHVEDDGRSPAPKGLPKCLYNGEWLRKLAPLEYEDLEVSEKPFALLVAATSRMVRYTPAKREHRENTTSGPPIVDWSNFFSRKMQTSTSHVPAPPEYLHGYLRQGNDIFTIYCGNRKFMSNIPAPKDAPSPSHTSMDGDYRHITWTSIEMPYLIFLPRSNPFHGSLFGRLNVTTQQRPNSSNASPLIASDVGWSADPALVTKWTELENALRSVLKAMYAEYPGSPFEGMLSVPFPSQFGYRNSPWPTREQAAVVLRHSRDAFLPFMATIAMMFVLLDHPHRDDSWRIRVMNASNVHPQWFADLESSAAGDMNIERVGGLLTACVGKLSIPLYLYWGAIDEASHRPMPSVLTERKFFPDHTEIQYLRSLSGSVSFSAWDRRGEVYVSRRDVNLYAPQASSLTPTAPSVLPSVSTNPPVETASGSSTSPLDIPAENIGQTSPPFDSQSGQKAGEAVRAFLARRNEKYEKWAATETPAHRTKRSDRERNALKGAPPGRKGATVFIWEEEDDFLIRTPLSRESAADRWDEFTPAQRHYDSWANEWDLCLALAIEEDAGADDDGEGYVDILRREPDIPTLFDTSALPDAGADDDGGGHVNILRPERDSPALPDIPASLLPDDGEGHINILPPEPEFPALPDVQASLLPEEPIGPHSTADDLQAVYTSWNLDDIQEYDGDDHFYEPFLDMEDVPYSRFGFTVPGGPAQYRERLRDDFCARSVGDEEWPGLQRPQYTHLPALLAYLSQAKSLEDVPRELLDLRQDEADISFQAWAVDVQRKDFNGRALYIIQPCNPGDDSNLHILLPSAATTLEIVRKGWGSLGIQEIVFHLFQRGVEFHLCFRGPLHPQPRPPHLQTGLGYVRDAFLRSPRGRAARFAGGIIGRLSQDVMDDELAARGPSDEMFENGVRFWDGQSQTAFWDDDLTPEEMDLICGVYVVKTGLKSSAENDGWQKKEVSWWPKPGAFFLSGLNIGWWSPDCERWFQKRLLEIEHDRAQLWTQIEWKHKIRFIQKSRQVMLANEKLAAEYLHHKLVE
ncbi:hypothetical protein MVEN_02215000 [Mycena venus]|uniref:Uncharacterized protein n=1 Tax=Mycena venus TaxID=2733690 RepID=A0A8H7CFC8_9AGAR|nr:hypothetical protein MVEN_02215000 [Mycena venus]